MKTPDQKKPKAIWLFAGGAMQRVAAEKIRERGFVLIMSDGSAECSLRPIADEFLHVDIFAIAENIAKADELKQHYDIRAVFTAASDCHETVSVVAKHLGLPGIDPHISHVCRYKYETRTQLTEAGIPQPKFRIIKSYAEGVDALRDIGVPAALKATNNSGSRGFSRIETIDAFTEAVFARAIENGTTKSAIIEELLVPVEDEIAEQSVETLWYDGEMIWLNWVDRLFRKDFDLFPGVWEGGVNPYQNVSWAVELAHINPAVHATSTREVVEDMVLRAGVALGMDKQKGGHLLKADLMLTKDGPRIIELTPRLSGGWDSSWSTPRRGADFVGGMLGLALGETLTSEYKDKYFTFHDGSVYSAVLSKVKMDAQDCIGRQFAPGAGHDRTEALRDAHKQLQKGEFLT